MNIVSHNVLICCADIAKSATEILYDSPIPSKPLSTNLVTGDLVKLVFTRIRRTRWLKEFGLKLWDKVGLYFGELHNEPLGITALAPDQVIWFHPNHVFYIDRIKD
jgi:hypothetical protein